MSDSKNNRRENGQFAPGWKGPGRPKGSRHKLAESFLEAYARDFEQHGPSVLERVRQEEPGTYLRVAASVLPKEMNVAVERSVKSLTDDELVEYLQERSGSGVMEQASGAEGDSAIH